MWAGSTQKSISEITLELFSPAVINITVDIKLLTSNAGWATLYDLKFEDPSKDLGFVFRANVFNSTDINWKDVKMTLSTASPSYGFNLLSLSDASSIEKTEINYQDQNIKFRQIQTNDEYLRKIIGYY